MGQSDDLNRSCSVSWNVKLLDEGDNSADTARVTFDHDRICALARDKRNFVGSLRSLAYLFRCELLKQCDHVFNPGFFKLHNFCSGSLGDINPVYDFSQSCDIASVITNDQCIR